MNKIYIYILLVFISISFASSPKWYIEVVDNTYCVGDYSSLKLDSNDYPHISYWDYGYKVLRYAYFDGSKWNIEVVDSNGNTGSYTSIAIDSKNHPHISYTGDGNLRYAYFDGYEWHKEIIDNICHDTSIALDSKEHPHISYNKGNPYEDLKYAYFDGTKWNIKTVDSQGKVGWYTSIAIDSNDHPHISYDDETNWHLKYAYFDGTKWNIETVDDRIFTGRCTSIDIDSNNLPHIAYLGSGLNYAYFDGSKWNIETVDNDHIGGDISLSLDSYDYPHISYGYWTDDIKRLMYAYYDGKEWHKEVVDEGTNIAIAGTSIDLDKYDFPHISYNDADNLRYARYGYGVGIDLTSFTAKPNNDAITLNWYVTTNEDISGFNLYRRIMPPGVIHELPLQYSPVGEIHELSTPVGEDDNPCPNADSQWTKINTSLITGTNPYSYTDRDITPETKYEYKLEAVTNDTSEMLGTTECTSEKGTPESFDITSIYPCPASDYINCVVSVSDAKVVNISIYDISGRIVSKSFVNVDKPSITEVKINTGELSNGVYILTATTETEIATKRFVIVR